MPVGYITYLYPFVGVHQTRKLGFQGRVGLKILIRTMIVHQKLVVLEGPILCHLIMTVMVIICYSSGRSCQGMEGVVKIIHASNYIIYFYLFVGVHQTVKLELQ